MGSTSDTACLSSVSSLACCGHKITDNSAVLLFISICITVIGKHHFYSVIMKSHSPYYYLGEFVVHL